MFDLRTEAEMRLHSDKMAKELALKKQREEAEETHEDPALRPPSDES